ncbi:hypothetical protein BDW22DRAFT_874573 [Trametopsis cervina]|nr:hypothetical protein BDW22DRAFT_874573 [Trametopsis cervina]
MCAGHSYHLYLEQRCGLKVLRCAVYRTLCTSQVDRTSLMTCGAHLELAMLLLDDLKVSIIVRPRIVLAVVKLYLLRYLRQTIGGGYRDLEMQQCCPVRLRLSPGPPHNSLASARLLRPYAERASSMPSASPKENQHVGQNHGCSVWVSSGLVLRPSPTMPHMADLAAHMWIRAKLVCEYMSC